jgi:acyl dehydratase
MSSWTPPGFEDAQRQSWPMRDEVALAMIRLWCEVIEDANPVYYDADVARANGFPGIIAPPAMILTWFYPAEWSPTGGGARTAETLKRDLPDFPHSVGLRSVQTHARPLVLGERLTASELVAPPSAPQPTERGFGPRQVRYRSLVDEAGTEASGIEYETLRMAMPDGDDHEEVALAPMPRYDGVPAGSARDAEAGQVLPSLALPLTLKRCIKWVGASRDFFEAHLDGDYARRTGARDLYVGIHFFYALVGRAITDWTGPAGFVERMEFTHWGRCFPGETASVTGRVAAVRRAERTVLDLEIAAGCERGKLYDVRASVGLDRAPR